MKPGHAYIMTNFPNGTLYVGVTARPRFRIGLHRQGKGSAFRRRYDLKRLAYIEEHGRIDDAIAREKAIKAWQRPWKIRLISDTNPDWRDLYGDLNR